MAAPLKRHCPRLALWGWALAPRRRPTRGSPRSRSVARRHGRPTTRPRPRWGRRRWEVGPRPCQGEDMGR
eukprot:4729724-Alexandrium_andersonii.AAC.1